MDKKFYITDISQFDPTNAPVESIRKWLFAIIDAELEKDPSERNYDLIMDCSELEAELPASGFELSKEECAAGLERIKALAAATADENKKAENKEDYKEIITLKNKPKNKPKKSVRIIAILAASLATLILSLSVAAAVQGKPVIQFISDNIKTMFGMDTGDKLEDDGVTLVKNGELFNYSSIEEAIKSIDSDMLYPTYLPEGIKVDRVVVTNINENAQMSTAYVTNYKDLSIMMFSNVNTTVDNLENSTLYDGGTIDFYIVETPDKKYQAMAIYENIMYNIKYTNYDELIKILDGIKEIEK